MTLERLCSIDARDRKLLQLHGVAEGGSHAVVADEAARRAAEAARCVARATSPLDSS